MGEESWSKDFFSKIVHWKYFIFGLISVNQRQVLTVTSGLKAGWRGAC